MDSKREEIAIKREKFATNGTDYFDTELNRFPQPLQLELDTLTIGGSFLLLFRTDLCLIILPLKLLYLLNVSHTF